MRTSYQELVRTNELHQKIIKSYERLQTNKTPGKPLLDWAKEGQSSVANLLNKNSEILKFSHEKSNYYMKVAKYNSHLEGALVVLELFSGLSGFSRMLQYKQYEQSFLQLSEKLPIYLQDIKELPSAEKDGRPQFLSNSLRSNSAKYYNHKAKDLPKVRSLAVLPKNRDLDIPPATPSSDAYITNLPSFPDFLNPNDSSDKEDMQYTKIVFKGLEESTQLNKNYKKSQDSDLSYDSLNVELSKEIKYLDVDILLDTSNIGGGNSDTERQSQKSTNSHQTQPSQISEPEVDVSEDEIDITAGVFESQILDQSLVEIYNMESLQMQRQLQKAIELHLEGTQISRQQAYAIFLALSKECMPQAIYFVGYYHYWGYVIATDRKQAIKLFQDASELGCSDALDHLGLHFALLGDHITAFSFYLRAGQYKNPKALYHLFECYWYGLGTSQDSNLAMDFLNQAAQLRHPKAKIKLESLSQEVPLLFEF